jgi:hypothetical protein
MLEVAALQGACVDAREVSYSVADSILYALTLGYGADPLDLRQLRFVYEQHLQALPTLPLVIGYPGFFMRNPRYDLGWERLLHAEEQLVLHRPLPPAGIVRDCTYIDAIADRGAAKGCFVYTRKELHSEMEENSLQRGLPGTRGERAQPWPGGIADLMAFAGYA